MHTTAAGHRLAYHHRNGRAAAGVVFLHGFRSDMESTKAAALAEWCAIRDVGFTAFDCFAHGRSDGDFLQFTIGRAVEDALEILDHTAVGPQILVGSSMGGWVALHAALQRREQVRGIVGIAAAPDFTELMYLQMTSGQRTILADEGVLWVPGDYGGDYPITRSLLTDGTAHLLLGDAIPLEMPVHLLHGQCDAEVPWETALRIAERIGGEEVTVTLVKDGEHRLSRPRDIRLLTAALAGMLADMTPD